MRQELRFEAKGVQTARLCKLCDGTAELRYDFPTIDGPVDIHECGSCGFHFISALDPHECAPAAPLSEAEVVAGLESNADRIAANVALLLAHKAGGRLLDIGSGGGAFLASVPQFQAVGVEADPRYVAISRARGLTIATNLDGLDQFDAVTLWDVIEHVNDPVDTMRQAFDLLAPGGVLLLDTPNRDGLLYRLGETIAKLTRGRMGGTMAMQYSPVAFCHKQIFRARDLRRLLAQFGSVDISTRTEISFPADFYLRRFIRNDSLRAAIGKAASAILRALPLRNKLIVVAVKGAHQ